MIEIRHLRTLAALRETGSLAGAAERLHVTQSALSHQIKAVEAHYGCRLFQRKTRPVAFTAAGRRLLNLADELLPTVRAAEWDLAALGGAGTGRLHIAVECHACFEWLMPTMDRYREQWPTVEMDLSTSFSFGPLPALQRGDIDLIVTSDPEEAAGIEYTPLFEYQSLLAVADDHPLAGHPWVAPAELADETLITYPVERHRLDVFRRFLDPAGIQPAATRSAELPVMIMQLVASHRGVTALPEWVLAEYRGRRPLATRRLGRDGLWSTLYTAVRAADGHQPYMNAFVDLARETCATSLSGIRPTMGETAPYRAVSAGEGGM